MSLVFYKIVSGVVFIHAQGNDCGRTGYLENRVDYAGAALSAYGV